MAIEKHRARTASSNSIDSFEKQSLIQWHILDGFLPLILLDATQADQVAGRVMGCAE